jgi:hypothetical protein
MAWLTDLVLAVRADSRGTYGWRRVHAELIYGHGIIVNRKTIRTPQASPFLTDRTVPCGTTAQAPVGPLSARSPGHGRPSRSGAAACNSHVHIEWR